MEHPSALRVRGRVECLAPAALYYARVRAVCTSCDAVALMSSYHGSYDAELLVILLAKHCSVRLDYVEEFGYYSCHTSEKLGS